MISEADEQLLRDVRRLECRIGHGPEMESFEAEVAEATHEVSANVQMLRRSLRGANAVRQPYWRMIDGGREDSSPSSGRFTRAVATDWLTDCPDQTQATAVRVLFT